VPVGSNSVTLTNGGVVEARFAEATMMGLRAILSAHPRGPQLIEELHHLASGKAEEISPRTHAFFVAEGLITRDTALLLPEARDLILSAFRRVPDGIVLVDPYQSTEANRAAIKAVRTSFQEITRNLFGPGSGGADGHSGR
jgi:hypothetical protein